MILIDGKKLQKEILAQVKTEVATLPFKPIFCDVLLGDDPVSAQYVLMKAKRAEDCGIHFHNANFPASITSEELVAEIKKLNLIPHMYGLIVQLPLPASIDKKAVLDAIDPTIDVDCLGQEASKKFYEGESTMGFPTALACMALIDSLSINLAGKKIVVVGQGELVGKPVVKLLENRGLTPIRVDKSTTNKEEILREADIIISATGKGKLIQGSMIKQGVILIDAGTSESNGGIVGDVDLESVKDKASYVSPVPGGVGPVTVAMLLKNVLTVAEKKR